MWSISFSRTLSLNTQSYPLDCEEKGKKALLLIEKSLSFILRMLTVSTTFLSVLFMTTHWIQIYTFVYFCLGRVAYLLIKWFRFTIYGHPELYNWQYISLFLCQQKSLSQNCASKQSEQICWQTFCKLTQTLTQQVLIEHVLWTMLCNKQ